MGCRTDHGVFWGSGTVVWYFTPFRRHLSPPSSGQSSSATWTGIVQSVQRLTTDWKIRESNLPIQEVEWSKARVWDRSLSGVVGSNPAGGMKVGVVCVVRTKGKSQGNQDKEIRIKYTARTKKKIPVKVTCSTPVQTGPGAHPASYTMGIGYLFRG